MTARSKRLFHYWVSIPGGILFALWIFSGAAMVYDSVRGGLHAFPNIRRNGDLHAMTLPPAALVRNVRGPVSRLVLMTIGGRTYAQATTEDGVVLIDAASGTLLSPVGEATARALLAGYEGMPPVRVERITARGYEYRYGELPAWRGEFAGGRIIHIAATSGDVQSWTDRQGMFIRAMYYWFHSFQFTGSARINAAVAFLAIAWALGSVISGFVLYRRGGTAAIVALLMLAATARTANAATTGPHRIVTLAPSCAEVVAGLGLEERIVGVTEYTDWPARLRTVTKVGSYNSFSVEAVAALRPDLVVAADDGNPGASLRRLEALGIRVVTMHLRTYDDIARSVAALGHATGRGDEARHIVAEMRRVASCVAERTRGVVHPRVLLAYELSPIVSAGAGTFTDQLIGMAGGTSITHDVRTPFPRLTVETIAARAPEVIVVSSMNPSTDAERVRRTLATWPVASRRVHVIDSTNVDRPSQRIVLGLVLLARTLHPALFAHDECRAEFPR